MEEDTSAVSTLPSVIETLDEDSGAANDSRDSTPVMRRGRKPSSEVPMLKKRVTVAHNTLGTNLSQRSHKTQRQGEVYNKLKGKKIELSDLDVDGDGQIGTAELAVFVRLYNSFQDDYRVVIRMMYFLCIGICVLWFSLFATVIPLGLLSTELAHDQSNQVVDGDGNPLLIQQAVPITDFSCDPAATAALQWLVFPDQSKEAVMSFELRNDGTEAMVTTVNGQYLFPCATTKRAARGNGGTTQLAPATSAPAVITVVSYESPQMRVLPTASFTITLVATIANVPTSETIKLDWTGDTYVSPDAFLTFFGYDSFPLTQTSRNGNVFTFTGNFLAPPREGLLRPSWSWNNSYTFEGSVEITCSDGIFCNGNERWAKNRCTPAAILPCTGLTTDPCDNFACNETSKRCAQTPLGGAACTKTCAEVSCTPNCQGKTCGDNGCRGSCGSCTAPAVCSAGSCIVVTQLGSCANPAPLIPGEVIPDAGLLTTVIGDNSGNVNVDLTTPVCALAGVPEYVYKFTISNTVTGGMGFEIRATCADGTVWCDTLLAIHDTSCKPFTLTAVDRLCSDDQSPPGGYSSRVDGKLPPGSYTLVVTNYDMASLSDYKLEIKFTPDCYPKCEATFCGTDGCGGSCGTCSDGLSCLFGKCQQTPCVPQCRGKQCGPDGCGGLCGECKKKRVCDLAVGSCIPVKSCNGLVPQCPSSREGQGPDRYCGTDCEWHKLSEPAPDLIPSTREEIEKNAVFYWGNFAEGSCTLEEKCVSGSGDRLLFSFDTHIHNIGSADFVGAEILRNPQLYVWASCHQHYHYERSTRFSLYSTDGKSLVLGGAKLSYCLEDEYQHLQSPTIPCTRQFSCEKQGISRGRTDLYSFGIDCQWLDITPLKRNCWYTFEVCVNIARNAWEMDYDNNCRRFPIYVADVPLGPTRVTLQQAIARDNAMSFFGGCKP